MDIMYIDGELLAKMFKQGASVLSKNKEIVDELNVFPVPDGDTGTNMSLTMKSLASEVSKGKHSTVETVAKAASKGSLMGARGNSGVILSQIFRGFAKGCEDKETLTSIDLAFALDAAREAAYKAVMKPVEGTILTVIRETAEKAMEYTEEEIPMHDFLKLMIKQAESTLDSTPEHLDVLKEAGVVDAGGKGLVYILKGFNSVILGDELIDDTVEEVSTSKSTHRTLEHDIKFTYCTEFFIQKDTEAGQPFKDYLQSMGDSIVLVEDEEITKVHVHTNHPGEVLENALEYGEVFNLKIENMKRQHSELINKKEAKPVENAFISVVKGVGFEKIFEDLNIDYVIQGGQTMNPSTEVFVDAIESLNAKNIYILPNNGNIIMAAEQAAKVSDKNVVVVPTKTIPQGISAIMEFNENQTVEENLQAMTESREYVQTIEVTYAVRETNINGLEINKDDILTVVDGSISKAGASINETTLDCLEDIIDDETEFIAVYYGDDISKEKAEELVESIQEKDDMIDVELYYGGQPIYYYLISVE